MGKMTANDLQIQHHNILLVLRCQDRIAQSDIFAEAWDAADDKQKKECYRLLRKLKVDELKTWIARLTNNRSIRVLRQLASNHRISNYCNMSKEELLEILTSKGISYGESRYCP